MSAGILNVTAIGFTGSGAKLRDISVGFQVASFRMAVNKPGKNKQEGDTIWLRVEVYGKTAQFVAEKMEAGLMVYVEGDLRRSVWTGKDGKDRDELEIKAHTFQILRYKVDGRDGEDSPPPSRLPNGRMRSEPLLGDDDIPF